MSITASRRRALYETIGRHEVAQPATNFWRAIEIDFFREHFAAKGRVLDLGCGTGEVYRLLASAWREVTSTSGIDVDQTQLDIARSTGLYADLRVADAHALPFGDGSFDTVVSNSVIEHIPEPLGVFREIARVLARGGEFAATVPSAEFHDCLVGPRFPANLYLPTDRDAYLRSIDARLVHQTYFGRTVWEPLLQDMGFADVRFLPFLTERQTQVWERLSNVTGGVAWGLTGGRRRPIEAQRSLGLDVRLKTLSRLVNHAGGKLLSDEYEDDALPARHGCVLILGRRR